jgi:hypothetical protein
MLRMARRTFYQQLAPIARLTNLWHLVQSELKCTDIG